MTREATSPDPTEAAISAFLDVHYSHAHVNDVGPMLGLLASLRDAHRDQHGNDEIERELWDAAVSAALTGQAPPARR